MGRVASIVLTRREDGALSAAGDLSASFGQRIVLPDGSAGGIHAGWHWDGQYLAVQNDRYGFYPLFAWVTASHCAIASDLEALLELGAPRTLDYDALSVFLRLGFFVGDDTPFVAIRAVPPRAVLDWSPGGPRLTGRPPTPRVHAIRRDAAIDGLIDTFRAAIARHRPSGAFQMPLSGGRDSRHILLALIEAGTPPAACVTIAHFPPRGGDDIAVAAELCAAVQTPHIVLDQRRDRVAAEFEKNRRTHFCTDEHAQFMVLAAHLQASTRETYDGLAGDVLSQSSYLNPEIHGRFERGDMRGVAEYLLDGYGTAASDAALQRLVAPRLFRDTPRERAIARLLRELPRHASAPNPVSSFFFWNRTRREVALSPFAVMRPMTVHAPYLDRDVFDFLSGLPASLTLDGALHTDAIARAYPAVAGIRYDAKTRAARARRARSQAVQLASLALAPRTLLRPATLLPRLAATILDGDIARLWHTPLAVYLAQLAKLASVRAT